mmetsp:Transcript_856/g.1964  ORF Transcript_856/g.1964 Transcript_856/m.1964 type:complete len:85 (+) Transcript_856:121-375(+)
MFLFCLPFAYTSKMPQQMSSKKEESEQKNVGRRERREIDDSSSEVSSTLKKQTHEHSQHMARQNTNLRRHLTGRDKCHSQQEDV